MKKCTKKTFTVARSRRPTVYGQYRRVIVEKRSSTEKEEAREKLQKLSHEKRTALGGGARFTVLRTYKEAQNLSIKSLAEGADARWCTSARDVRTAVMRAPGRLSIYFFRACCQSGGRTRLMVVNRVSYESYETLESTCTQKGNPNQRPINGVLSVCHDNYKLIIATIIIVPTARKQKGGNKFMLLDTLSPQEVRGCLERF